MLITVVLAGLLSMPAVAVTAHEIEPAVADVEIGADALTIRLRTALEPLIAGIDLAGLDDTNEAPEAIAHDTLRLLPPADLEAELRGAWPDIRDGLRLTSDETRLAPEIVAVDIPEVGDPETRRDSTVTLTASLPAGGGPVVMGLAPELGTLIVRQGDGDESYEAFLTGGGLTEPMPRGGAVAEQGALALFGQYLWQGILHIVPMGLDHILFVLGLFFFAVAWRPLLWQVTTFTLAHTVTLALAALEVVSVSGSIVEPLIAASITYVAFENVWRGGAGRIGWGRIAVVFAFGLLHGLGFASVFGELDVSGNLPTKLVGFNIGVELGQLLVIAVAFALVGWFAGKPWYRRVIAIPASVAIGLVGLYWFAERTILA